MFLSAPTVSLTGLLAAERRVEASSANIANLAIAKTAYSANLAALRARDEMLGGLLDGTA